VQPSLSLELLIMHEGLITWIINHYYPDTQHQSKLVWNILKHI
jgi:hypothetical protein